MKPFPVFLFIGLISFVLLNSGSYGQTAPVGTDNYAISGIRLHYGFIIPHTKMIKKLARTNPFGFQADMGWQFNTEKAYRYCNCYPMPGISFYYWDFQNESTLGKAYVISAFSEAYFAGGRTLSVAFRPGLGLAYLSNPYDSVTNTENIAYSTKIGYYVLLNLSINYQLGPKWIASASFNYNHISNGGVKLPNKGLNFPTAGIGIAYSPKPIQYISFNKAGAKEYKQINNYLLASFIGFRGIIYNDKTYLVYGIFGKYLYHTGPVSYLSGGLEFTVDRSKIEIARKFKSVTSDAQYISGALAGYEHKFGSFRAAFDLGIYIRNPNREGDLLYQRYGLKYIFRQFFTGINLKAHRHYAEYFDIRAGILF